VVGADAAGWDELGRGAVSDCSRVWLRILEEGPGSPAPGSERGSGLVGTSKATLGACCLPGSRGGTVVPPRGYPDWRVRCRQSRGLSPWSGISVPRPGQGGQHSEHVCSGWSPSRIHKGSRGNGPGTCLWVVDRGEVSYLSDGK
jgi:hypothetical protein